MLDDREIICVVEHYKWGQFCMDKIAVANGSNHRQSKVLMCSCKEVWRYKTKAEFDSCNQPDWFQSNQVKKIWSKQFIIDWKGKILTIKFKFDNKTVQTSEKSATLDFGEMGAYSNLEKSVKVT